MHKVTRGNIKSQTSWQFILLAVFLLLVFLTGGSSRGDATSLVLLRPISVTVCAVALCAMTRAEIRRNKSALLLGLSYFLIVFVYLIPLPRWIGDISPSYQLNVQITEAAGLVETTSNFSAVPTAAWNGLFFMFTPAATFLLACQLPKQDSIRLLNLTLILGLTGGLLGLIQVLGSPEGPLYFYSITNNGSAVGFFSNRNHQAVLLAMMFPMLAVFATEAKNAENRKFRLGVAAAAGALLIPLLLVTGSRAGLVVGTIGLISAVVIYHSSLKSDPSGATRRKFFEAFGILVLVLLMSTVTFALSRAEAIDRLFVDDVREYSRLSYWLPILEMANNNLPLGTGPGSFPGSYAVAQPIRDLTGTYLNRAHNDWLELYADFGLLAIFPIGLLTYFVLNGCMRIFFEHENLRSLVSLKLALTLIVIAAAGSIGDYPLRTPILSSLFAIALFWLNRRSASPWTKSDSNQGPHETPAEH